MHFTFKLRDQLEGNIPSTYNKGGGSPPPPPAPDPNPFYGPGMSPAESSSLATISGGTPAPNVAGPTAATPYTPAPIGSPNINQAAAQAIYGAGGATAQGLGTPLMGANIAAYQNPYTQQVIDATAADTLRNAQIGMNALDTQASRAGAFGGSRHGVAQAEMGRGVAQMLGQQAAGLRQAGFENAQRAAQFDIAQNQAAAQQLANIGQQGFGMGQTIQQNLMQQGNQQQAMQQALLDAAKTQYGLYQQQPLSSLGYVSAALGATPVPMATVGSGNQQKQLGLMDYLTAGAKVASMF
jgi:hypothetical protein